jgi:phasin family protein
MTLLTPEQFAAAQKANFEALFGLTNKAFEGVEKLVELNLQVVKSTLAESQENAQRALSVKDAQELLALQASLAQPVAEKVLSYGRPQYEEQNRKVQALVDNVAKNAPAGSETAVAVMKSAITAANTTYETVHKATKQAVEIAESNFNAAATAATKAAQQAASQASRAAATKKTAA